MSIKVDEAKLLGLLGDEGERWVQGGWGDGQAMCLHGAIRRCAPVKGDAFLIEQVAQTQGWGTDWNDDDGTTWADVRDRLAHVEVTDDDLADTFGPQWEHIVALVRRVAVLTPGEVKRLAASWAAAGAAARFASRAAAPAAAEAAAWDAAAAGALAARHLISPDGFTQEHYDVLTGPWSSVIGPVHPDDPALGGDDE